MVKESKKNIKIQIRERKTRRWYDVKDQDDKTLIFNTKEEVSEWIDANDVNNEIWRALYVKP
jgi:hypothetical protein